MRVEYYELSDGTEPAKDFINSLDVGMKNKMFREIELLEAFGTELRMPHSKHLDDGIFELRAKFSSNISRVLYFFFYQGKAILTNGFVKKTDKTPQEEIKIAKNIVQIMKKEMGGKIDNFKKSS